MPRIRVHPTLSLFMVGVGYIPGAYLVIQLPLMAVLFGLSGREDDTTPGELPDAAGA